MIRKLVSRVLHKPAKYHADPDCCEVAVGDILDKDAGDGVAEPSSCERVHDDVFLLWVCCEILKGK